MSSTSNDASRRPSDLTRWWNRTRYQLYAPIYDWVARPLEHGRRRAIEQLDLTGDERILILGAGPGSDLPHLPPEASITAVDAAPAMVRRARERAGALGMDINARVGDAQALPFEDESFDVVLLHLILSVVPEPEAVAKETARVLAPGGQVSIYDKFIPEGSEPSLLRRALNPLTRFLFSDITRQLDPLLSEADLEVIEPRDSALGGLYTIAQARLHPEETRTDRSSSPDTPAQSTR